MYWWWLTKGYCEVSQLDILIGFAEFAVLIGTSILVIAVFNWLKPTKE